MGDSTYRLSVAQVLRTLGPIGVVLGVLWVLVAVTTPGDVIPAILGLVTLAVAILAAVALLRPPPVLRLSAEDYRITFVRGAGVTRAQWREVVSARTDHRHGTPCLVIELAGGRSSVLPLAVLGADSAAAQRDLHARLNAAHGYRRL